MSVGEFAWLGDERREGHSAADSLRVEFAGGLLVAEQFADPELVEDRMAGAWGELELEIFHEPHGDILFETLGGAGGFVGIGCA